MAKPAPCPPDECKGRAGRQSKRTGGTLPLVVTFGRGLNTTTLTALPFRPRTCHVPWLGHEDGSGCDFATTIGLSHTVGDGQWRPSSSS